MFPPGDVPGCPTVLVALISLSWHSRRGIDLFIIPVFHGCRDAPAREKPPPALERFFFSSSLHHLKVWNDSQRSSSADFLPGKGMFSEKQGWKRDV